MSTIKGLGPQLPVTQADQAQAAVPASATKEPTTKLPQDGFQPGGTSTAPTEHTPVTGAVLSGLTLIASLRQHPLFGSGARVKPLKAGEQSLGDHTLDPALLAVDLAAELEQDLGDPGCDSNRRAAITALFASYPGGPQALTPVS